MRKALTVLFSLAAAASPMASAAQEIPPAPTVTMEPTPSDPAPREAPKPADFAARAAADNLYFIRSAQMALEISHERNVRDMAETFLREHEKAQRELENAARSQGMTLQPELNEDQLAKLQALRAADPAEFDDVYRSGEMIILQSALERLSVYADTGAGGPLKAYAVSFYPTFRSHFIVLRSSANSQ
ncbi:DUF4142 domain-containing protein [Rhizobium sp. L1K21]|uniref:DUF4142 domain-containing protein n=1 Tax=Rhizobium sp. L1K21 TaxID=2954933 RepID=UPI0020939491|nr:DUF4142 domain-containing protein [Rhizobium sp. L1K21]MCO6187833.1 DUF4142 domain-containing protein [Rhizobium sp. L1K21]